MSLLKRIITNWAPVIIYASILFYLSSRPISSPVEVRYLDTALHILFYAILALLLARAVNVKTRASKWWSSFIVVALSSLYGAANEWYQGYVPTRTPSLLDGAANLVGSFIGMLVYIKWICYLGQKRS